MAAEDIQVVRQVIETAAFNTKDRILHLPIWKGVSDDLYNMLITHEIGHALYTPETYGDREAHPVFNRIPSAYINIIEDVRIERLVKNKYPGVIRAFTNGYKEIMKLPGFSVGDVNSLSLIDRINLYYKGGMMMGIIFTDEEKEFVDSAYACKTFEDVLELSEKIYEFAKENSDSDFDEASNQSFSPEMGSDNEEEDMYEKPNGQSMPFGESEDEESDSEDSSDGDSDDSNSSESDKESGEGKDSDKTESSTDENSGSEPSDKLSNDETDNKVEANVSDTKATGSTSPTTMNQNVQKVEALTDEIFNTAIDSIEKETNSRFVPQIARIPKFNVEDYIIPAKVTNMIIDDFFAPVSEKDKERLGNFMYYNRENNAKYKQEIIANFDSYVSENSKVVNYLAKEFEMKKAAFAHRNAKVSKTGKLNMSKVFKYQVSEDIFLRKTTIKNAKSHGLILLVDWSGSMNNCIRDAIHQTINTVMFAKRVGIPFEVYSFGAQGSTFSNHRRIMSELGIELPPATGYMNTPQIPVEGDLDLGQVALRQYITSDMNSTDYKNALVNLALLADRLSDTGYNSWNSIPPSEGLGNTPLNVNLLRMGKIIERFKAKNNVQKVNLAIMTDGASASIDGTFGRNSWDGSLRSYRSDVYTIKDGYNSYEIDSSTSFNETSSLIEMLRKKYQINVIGFYISANARELRYAISNYVARDPNRSPYGRAYLDDKTWSEKRKEYNKNKYLETTVAGFTKYFIIPGKREAKQKEMSQDMSKAQLKTAFIKNLNSNTDSRVVMTKFIELIA